MKKFTTLSLWVIFILVALSNSSMAQFKSNPELQAQQNKFGTHTHNERCGSMEWLANYFRENPGAEQQFNKNEELLGIATAKKLKEFKENQINGRTQAIITIPVVFHIVLSNPASITDAMVQAQLDVLNKDYGGTNADSTNATNFYNIRGHSNIRFCLAQRTPTNAPTNGINRVTSSTLSNSSQTNDPVKSSAAGGADAWDPTKYINIWLCNYTNSSLLGYATFPIGTAENPGGPLSQQGVTARAQTVPGGSAAPYNLGRTLTHELGHFFWLRHIWGDSNCGNDFPGSPSGLDDTPQQSGSTGGCPTGAQPTNCTGFPNPPGKNYQNYMDYTDDACMTMFTIGQGARAEAAIDLYRPGLKTSNGCTPPVSYPNDAGVSILSPTSGTALCTGTTTPQITLYNYGNNALTSVSINLVLNGGTPTVIPWTGNLASFTSTTLTLSSLTLAAGPNTITVYTSNPNGTTDGNTTNDQAQVTNVTGGTSAGIPGPLVEGFEGTTFPPAGWTLINPNTGSITWARSTLAAKSGTASARLNFYSYTSAGHVDMLQTPIMNMSQTQLFVDFAYAYKTYISETDELDVRISTDCGATWTSLWKKSGLALASSTPPSQTASFTPSASDWKSESINISTYRNVPFIIEFKTTNQYGNNLYLDDINIFGSNLVNNDARVSVINKPLDEFCADNTTPQVVVENKGLLPLTSVLVNYKIDAGAVVSKAVTGLNLATGATTTVDLTAATGLTNGTHVFTAYTTLPNGVADEQSVNDTLRKNFFANVAVALPISEGFEGTTFPPTGWAVINPNAGSITWARTIATAKTGAASVGMNFYNYATAGHLDYLRAPAVNFNNAFDSALMTFQYAYRRYNGTLNDTLAVVVSTDCGVTWNEVWKKGGSELATNPAFSTGNWIATPAEWTTAPIRVNLGAYLNSGQIFIAMRSRNGYGNNLFVDDINIFGKNIPNYDAALNAINAPGADICDLPLTPKVTIANQGKVTMTSVKVSYTIDGGSPVTSSFTGLNVPLSQSTTLSLTNITSLSAGNHVIKVYTSEPNGQVDQNFANDTLVINVKVLTPVTNPVTETFESTTFPPAGWDITQNPIDAITWARTTAAGKNSTASAYMNNWNYAFTGRTDQLVSPAIKYSGADSVFIKFDVAAFSYSYPGSTAIPMDTLEVLVTSDCGITYQSVYKKWGYQLQTLNSPNNVLNSEFIPLTNAHWRTDSINVTSILGSSNVVRFMIRNTENYENNIFVDNINFTPKVLPAKLKNNGVLISPSPFQTAFAIQHYRAPIDLRGFGVYNSVGQQVLSQSFGTSGADSYIHVDMNRLPAGVYTVKLIYTNRTVSQKIVKLGK